MSFKLSKRSLRNLEGVDKSLSDLVVLAITMTEVDFVVIEGLRTRERQEKLVASGASMTMNSKHLIGHAVDLAAWVDGTVRWDWSLYPRIAEAMREAAFATRTRVTWGGCWNKELGSIPAGCCEMAVANYAAERRRQGGTPFIDGPHFELRP